MTQLPDSYTGLFLRFLRFGVLAWGGPVAQIAMIRQELVEEERWIDRDRFNRVLGVYQALPGPEAHELCVYFGYQRKGRIGGLLAGLGFMLPGFTLMFALSWLYVTYGIEGAVAAGLFYGFAPAVTALVVRAVHRIGSHALLDRWLWCIALASALALASGLYFLVPLVLGGLAYLFVRRGARLAAGALIICLVLSSATLLIPGEGQLMSALTWSAGEVNAGSADESKAGSPDETAGGSVPSLVQVAASGLRTGLLTFGGAYTAIPFLQHDAVVRGDWITNSQFLDGLALSSVLPAPLIIFSTFVGYIAAGPWAALVMTVAIFAPAFAFTLAGHGYVERLVDNPRLHAFLDGVTASVVGFITVAAITLLSSAVSDAQTAAIFVGAVIVLHLWKTRLAVVVVMLAAGLVGVAATLAA